jgi:hypothetical protein
MKKPLREPVSRKDGRSSTGRTRISLLMVYSFVSRETD